MTYKFLITLFIFALPTWLLAQDNADSDDWVINEVYASDSPSRYGLFVELYNPKGKKVSPDFFLSDDKSNPYQFRLRTKAKYKPDILLQRGYQTFKISTLRFKRRTIKIYGNPDSLYLFKRVGNEFRLKDSFPVTWSDSISTGRCKNQICRYNISTPGRENKNVETDQYMPQKLYRVSVLPGASWATNTGFGNDIGRRLSGIIKVQKVVNRRIFYTATSAGVIVQGYSFNNTEVTATSTGQLTRHVNGNYSAFQLFASKDIGAFITPRFDISCGAALVLYSFAWQKYDEDIALLKNDGTTLQTNESQTQQIGNYNLPVLAFNAGINYKLNS